MPFTISHAAAALPFFRSKLSRSALVIGTMVPDIPVFTSFDYYVLSHSFAGVFLFNLPIGLLVWLFWTYILRSATQALCPSPLRKALFSPRLTPHYVTILLSLSLGALTHQVWDGFTHRSGFTVTYIPLLLEDIAGYPFYSWLQLLSSIFGLAVLVLWIKKQWDSSQAFTFQHLVSIFALPLSVLALAVFYATQVRRLNDGIVFIYGVVISSTKIMVAFYLFLVAAYNLFCWLKHKTSDKATALADP